jgi:hypothetical protein
MKAKEAARSGVNGSPCVTPMAKTMVGPMNCRKPMNDSGMRRAAQEKSTNGTAVTGPHASSHAVAGRLAPKCPAPVACSQST